MWDVSLKNIQKQVDKWVSLYKIGYFPPHEILARLTEEVGELAREINHRYGSKKKKATENEAEMAGEMAYIIFTVACMANREGIDLDKAFKKVMDKCYGRDKDRYARK